tara:strand:+ start:196 stop:552 length:357 start_codon:yes stop_codon:yes gene_type:complete
VLLLVGAAVYGGMRWVSRRKTLDQNLIELRLRLKEDGLWDEILEVGNSYLESHPNQLEGIFVKFEEFNQGGSEVFISWFERHMEDDFSNGMIEVVDGYIVARSEVELCVLLKERLGST